jgi:hypothetical protein
MKVSFITLRVISKCIQLAYNMIFETDFSEANVKVKISRTELLHFRETP